MKAILLCAFTLALLLPLALWAESYNIEGQWYNAEKTSKIQIYKTTSGSFAGKIVWLKEPNNEAGKPKVDDKNPDKDLRSRPLLNLVIVKGLTAKGNNKFDNGTIYDPKSGNTYSSKAELTGPNTMKLRGFIGISLVGRTEVWTRANK
ncbi:MAG TPA: DUF2147 domain-containing protein [Candidatus Syntrophosphaera sp.]|nr:DUF2147 domain-containing protein [Candidatus Syntrophosphaera sp.]